MKKYIASAAIVACLLLAFVVPASAHGVVSAPHVIDGTCNITVSEDFGTWNSSGNLNAREYIQEIKNSDGTSCNEFRSVTEFYSTVSRTINFRLSELIDGGGGAHGANSTSSQFTTTASTHYTYVGNWVSGSCFSASGEVTDTATEQTFPSAPPLC